MVVVPLGSTLLDAYAALFEACHSTCYCRFLHFTGAKNDWLARCATAPEQNRDEQAALVRAGDDAARGLLAMHDDAALGWMKLAPRARLTKLTTQGAYRALDLGDPDGVWAIGCMLVHPEHRGRGVARALVDAAASHVRVWGGRAVEGYPRRADYRLHDEEAHRGTEAMFRACGFTRVAGESPDAPYPVYRRDAVAT